MRRALISVSDKTGIVKFANELVELGFEIVSTGGTAKALKESGVPVYRDQRGYGFPGNFRGQG